MHPADADWPDVQALQSGDDQALNRLIQRHRDAITRFIFRIIGNRADAEELAQECFVRAYFQIHSYRPRARFAAWLFQIARNLCRDHFRSRAFRDRLKSDRLEDQILEDLPASERGGPEAERVAIVQAALLKLPLPLRESLVLTAIEGLTLEQASGLLGITSKAVEVRTYRASRMLRKILEKI